MKRSIAQILGTNRHHRDLIRSELAPPIFVLVAQVDQKQQVNEPPALFLQ